MRIATMIIGFLLGVVMTMQVIAVNTLANIAYEFGEPIEGAGGIAAGYLVVILWLVGIAFNYAAPKVSIYTFAFAGVIAFLIGIDGVFVDMWAWAIASGALSVMSRFGVKEKEKKDAEKAQLQQAVTYMMQQKGTV